MGDGNREYLVTRGRRTVRHVRAHGQQALITGITVSGVVAGFQSASSADDEHWPIQVYVVIAAVMTALSLLTISLRGRPRWGLPRHRTRPRIAVLPSSAFVETGPRRDGRSTTLATPRPPRNDGLGDDPVYAGGLRELAGRCDPLIVIPSNRRDVGRPHELPLPLFAGQGVRSRVEVDPRRFDVPLPPYVFERELPDGVHDVDHTLAVKDLTFLPELAAALDRDPGTGPVMLPEHCVDLPLLAERDVVLVGGPDTNFWHGVMYEAVAREFASPPGPLPLALGLRDGAGDVPLYGSRSITVRMAGLGAAFRHTREDRTELDERLYPTYGMVLACRNPFAAALGRSRWVVFVAGTRSLGTCGAVLGLVRMLERMRADPGTDFCSRVPVTGGTADVAAVLVRTRDVEQAVLVRDGRLTPRRQHRMPLDGIDPDYSDSFLPTGVEYLDFGSDAPRWLRLGGGMGDSPA